MTSLQNAFDPSSAAPAASGPKHGMPARASSSASPATSGASGPTTTSSTCSATAAAASPSMSSAGRGSTRASAAMPALPGAHSSSGACGERASACRIACSRPPPPTTRTRGESRTTFDPLEAKFVLSQEESATVAALDQRDEVVDRDRRHRFVLASSARAELERYARDRLVVGRLDHVDEVVLTERCPLCLDGRPELLD